MDYLKLACGHLGEDVADVLSHHVYDDRISIVMNHGIKGCPKFNVPLGVLMAVVVPEPQIESVEARPVEISATASAQTLAEKSGIDLGAIEGSGKDGKITMRDVKAAIGGEK